MTISRIIALDPGKTTGVADWDATAGGDPTVDLYQRDFKGVGALLMAVATDAQWDRVKPTSTLIIAESFIIGPQTVKNTQAPWSLEIIGCARMISQLYLGRDLKLQQPAAAKRFSSDRRLKRMGWWKPAHGHANDAARHLLLYMATHGMLTEALLSEFAEMP